MFPRKIHAVTEEGFLLKLVIFIISFSVKPSVLALAQVELDNRSDDIYRLAKGGTLGFGISYRNLNCLIQLALGFRGQVGFKGNF